MVKRFLALVVLAAAMAGCCAAQNVEGRVKAIRDAYAKAQARVKACATDANERNKFVVDFYENVAGGGPTQYKAELFFVNKNMANPDARAEYWVYFARVTRVLEGKTTNKEFLFDEKGRLMFYYAKLPSYTGGKSSEVRYYFDDKQDTKLVRMIEDGKTTNSPRTEDVDVVFVLREADDVRGMFDNMRTMDY